MKIRKSHLALLVVAATVSWLALVREPAAQNAPIVLKLAHGATADQAIGEGMLKFAELVSAKSGGTVKVETYLAGSLYSERTALEAMVNGAIDFAGASNANWAAFTDALLFMDLPYVFNDEASFRKVLDGPVGTEILSRFDKSGFKLLMELDNGGFRDLVNSKHVVRVPSDLKGLKMRSTASPVEIAMLKNWGAVPTAIDWAEVYNALGSAVVDGEFVQATWLATAKHYEVVKYATYNRAVIGMQTLAMRKDRFDQLPPAAQKVLLEAAKEAQAFSNQRDAEQQKAAHAYATSIGVQAYQPTAEEMQVWRSTGREIWKQFDTQVDKELLKQVLDAQAPK